MLTARVAQFKSRLSAYLQEVRRGGEVIIFDRTTPVAKVSPFSERENDLPIRNPKVKSGLAKLSFPPLRNKVDVVCLVRLSRGQR